MTPRDPCDGGEKAEMQQGPMPHGIRHLVGTGLVVTVLLVLLGATMVTAAILAHLVTGADFF